MVSHPTEVGTASAADLAADMVQHRKTYGVFLRLLRYVIAGLTVLLLALFVSCTS
jgi:hypothetical protein